MIDKNLLKELRPYKHQSCVIVFLDVLRTVAVLARCFCLADIIDKMIFSHLKTETAVPYLTLLFLFFVMEIVAELLIKFFAHGIAAKVKRRLRASCIGELTHGSPFGPLQKGDSIMLLTDGIGSFEPYFAKFLPSLLTAVLLPLFVIIIALFYDWISALIFLATLPLIPFLMFLIGKKAEAENERQWLSLTALSKKFMDLISGIMVIKIYNRSEAELERLSKSGNEFSHSVLRVLRIAFLSAFFIELVATLSIAIIAVDIAFRLLDGHLVFFPAIFILLVAPEFYQPLRNVSSMFHEAMGALVNAVKIYGALPQTAAAEAEEGSAGVIKKARLEFQAVAFSYDEAGKEAVHDLNFVIEGGSKVAFVGRSGAGKSTIFSLLLKFVRPQKGKILVDGTDLNAIEDTSWYKNIAYVPQSAHIFCGSLRENICLGQQASSEALQKALVQAGLDSWVETLPQKLDTLLGSGNRSISEGQKRRIALARAFLADAPLLLLDEPMEGIDVATEDSIQKSLDLLSAGRTVITIAHRLESIKKADMIYVIEEGTVIERGTHDELCQNQGMYYEMVSNVKEDVDIG